MIPNDNTRISNKTRLVRWKEKLREACLIRVERSRSELLWKIRSLGKCALEHKGYGDSAFDEIISDELVQIKQASQNDSLQSAYSDRQDMFWEYERCDGISELDQEDYEQIMRAMDKVLHEDSADKKEEDDVFVEDFQRTTLLVEDAFVASLIDQLQLQRDQVYHFVDVCGGDSIESSANLWIYLQKVDLDYMRRRICEVLKQHQISGCKSHPVFCIDNRFGISALYVQCCACEGFELVL